MVNSQNWKWIRRDPEIIGGQARIRGTRMSITMILNLLSSGASLEEIEEDFPPFNKECYPEILKYAALKLEGNEPDVAA